MKKLYLVSLIALSAVLNSRGDIIPTLGSISAEGSSFRWNYTTNVTVDQLVEPGDYFTIYDFGSLIPGSNIQPSDWSFTSLLLGTTPATVLPRDNPTIPNLTWSYNGTTPIAGSAFIGTFSVLSATDQLRTDFFAAHATRSSAPTAGTKIDNIGMVSVPVPEMSALAPIVGVCGFGAIGYLRAQLRRRRS